MLFSEIVVDFFAYSMLLEDAFYTPTLGVEEWIGGLALTGGDVDFFYTGSLEFLRG